jgi:hypothetical protein
MIDTLAAPRAAIAINVFGGGAARGGSHCVVPGSTLRVHAHARSRLHGLLPQAGGQGGRTVGPLHH